MSNLLEVSAQSEFLMEVVRSFGKRHRALTPKGVELLCERVIERDGDLDLEKIEIVHRRKKRTKSPVVRLHVWSDRWIWIDAREASSDGWRWQWTCEGRVLGNDVGRSLVAAFEETLSTIPVASGEADSKFDDIWKPLVATGPTSVVRDGQTD